MLMQLFSFQFPHLRDGHVVDGAVEDGGVVVDVLDAHPQRTHVLERRPPLVRRLHRHVRQLLAVGLVAVEDLKEKKLRKETVKRECNARARKNSANEFAISDAIIGRTRTGE